MCSRVIYEHELSWMVTLKEPSGSSPPTWDYWYSFTVPAKGISHMIIEASDGFTGDLMTGFDSNVNFEPLAFGEFGRGGSNPDMPGTMSNGIKFTPGTDDVLVFWVSFNTPRSPVWGDFYAKDGTSKDDNNNQFWNTAWNAGFTEPDTDPTAPWSNGPVDFHLLVPDTTSGTDPIPVPGSLLLVLTGTPVFAFLCRKRRT